MKKKILFDGTCIKPMNSGVGNYALSLFKGLQACKGEMELHLLARSGIRVAEYAASTQFVGVAENLMRKISPWDFNDFGSRYSLLHEPNFIPQRFSGPVIVTVHDLTAFLFPRLHPISRVYWASLFRCRMIAADHILTVSENSKRDIVDCFGVPADKVTVTYLGCSLHQNRQMESDEESRLLSRLNIRKPFILGVGTLEPRKNIARLLEAFSLFCRQGVGREVDLVLAGGKGWKLDGLFHQIAGHGLADRVVVTGYVSNAELSMLYRRAVVFAYPSLYEGFGLPPLEAMAHGTPVIVSNSSSLPEVVGDAGIMVDPQSIEEIVQALRTVVESKTLREQMRTKGRERAATFSWDRCAAQTMDVYRRVLG